MADDRIDQYRHEDKQRKNNPPVGLVSPETDQDGGPTRYEFDPHLDPQLIWSGKKRTEDLEIPTVSLHTHERIDPQTILEKVRKEPQGPQQISLFESVEEDLPLRQAIDFYEHEHGWSNRLIAGDSLLVMNSLLQKEGLADSIQMVYFDPPYGIDYGSNFQPFVGDRSVPHEDDEYLTREPEMVQAYRDTWELGIHSYLTYLREIAARSGTSGGIRGDILPDRGREHAFRPLHS
jgi:adenine-specific DNA-methyltransferase